MLDYVVINWSQGYTEPTSDKLLPDLHPMEQHVFTLVLDLNETLVYSDWKVSYTGVICPYTVLLRTNYVCKFS